MKTISVAAVSLLLPLASAAQQATKPVAKVTVPNSSRQDAARQETSGTTIYKLVDDQGRVTYSNRPMKGAEVVDLDPITVIPAGPRMSLGDRPPPIMQQTASATAATSPAPTPANNQNTSMVPTSAPAASSGNQVALVQPILPNVEPDIQKKRDDSRRKILEDELKAEQKLLADAVIALSAVESDRTAIEQMRLAAAKQTPAAYAEARRNYELREERLRTMQEAVATHEKNLTALKRELTSAR